LPATKAAYLAAFSLIHGVALWLIQPSPHPRAWLRRCFDLLGQFQPALFKRFKILPMT
jgi:hypothetical protein